jgi:hypothetical protein
MKCTILILAILMVLVLFAESRSPINISGTNGDMLLAELSDNLANNSSLSASDENMTINLTQGAQSVDISGHEGQMLLQDIMNTTNVTNETGAYANLSMWGSAPKKIPQAPDSSNARTIEILRMNHMGY